MIPTSAVLVLGIGEPVLSQTPEPAARLRIAVPAEPGAEPVTRGGFPEDIGFAPVPAGMANGETFGDRVGRMFTLPKAGSGSGPLGFGLLPSALDPTTPPIEAVPQTNEPTTVDKTLTDLKAAVFPPSNSRPPTFEPVSAMMPLSGTNFNAPLPSVPVQTSYASPPAYRWYGWGTTVPGANPYAPSGKSPQGSAGWYSQSRATPGAFPAAAAASVPSPIATNTPPAYTGPRPAEDAPIRPATRLEDLRQPVLPATPAPAPMSAPPAPMPTPAPKAAPAPLPFVQTHAATPVAPPAPPLPPPLEFRPTMTPIAVSTGTPSSPISTPPPTPGLTWTPAPAQAPTVAITPTTTGPRIEIIRDHHEPAPLPMSVTLSSEQLRKLISTACAGWATEVEVVSAGTGKVVVKFTALSESHAHAAAESVSSLPELKGFDVGFEARVIHR